jgi:lipopolysaccharide transport system ATP-binding protein
LVDSTEVPFNTVQLTEHRDGHRKVQLARDRFQKSEYISRRMPVKMISVENLHKAFKLYSSPGDRLKEILLRRKYHREFLALRGVSFQVAAGETLGIIGQNGAGKSTLLKILTGILFADQGCIHIDGKITGLLELGTGFNPEFSGLQNIFLNGALLGLSKKEISNKLDAIVQFTELDDFIREPIKTYSSGMLMRLAFAVAVHADPQAFVVDEALAVGDAYFQQKCMKKIQEFKDQGGSIVFVSHDMNAVKILCDQALLLDGGAVIEQGEPEGIINGYNFLLARKSQGESIQLHGAAQLGQSYGNLKVEISDVQMENALHRNAEIFITGESCSLVIHLKAAEKVDGVTVGMLIRDKYGQDIFGTNTHHLNLPIHLDEGQECLVRYTLSELNIGPGKYTLTVAAHREDTHLSECYQWMDVVRSFEVVGNDDYAFIGLARLKPSVQLELS